MEAFSLLKYWKGAGGGGTAAAFPAPPGGNGATMNIVAAGDVDSDGDADEGPFFDLEFAVQEDEEIRKLERENGEVVDDDEEDEDDDDEEEDGDEDEGEAESVLKLRPPSSSGEHSDPDVSLSPSDDLLFKGRIIRIDGSEEGDEEEVNSKSGQFSIPVSLLRSATKFRVFMLGLKRSKSESNTTKSQPQKENQQQNNNRKLFTVKFKVEEVPVISLLSRASSNSKTNSNNTATSTAASDENPPSLASDSGDEKRNKKEVMMQKYLKMVKPRYIRVSKRNQAASAAAEEVKGLNLKGMMTAKNKKSLGKSKSAAVYSTVQQNVGSKRRDDSLLQQQDGIQGAILHCKRSLNASLRDLEEKEDSAAALTRSASDPSHEKKRTTAARELTRDDETADDVVRG